MYQYSNMPSDKFKKELLHLILKIKKRDFLDRFLQDLLTPKEYEETVKRWQIVKQLIKKIPQRTISKNLGVSITTVTRGARVLRDKKSAFRQILKKQK